MIASLGLAIAIRYSVQAIFGPRFLRYDFAIAPGMKLAGRVCHAPAAMDPCDRLGCRARLPPAAAIHDARQSDARDRDQSRAGAGERRGHRAGDRLGVVHRHGLCCPRRRADRLGHAARTRTRLQHRDPGLLCRPDRRRRLGLRRHARCVAGRLCHQFRGRDRPRTARQLARRRRRSSNLRIPADYKPAIVYAAVVLVLLLRPSGLLRREID